MMVTFISQCEKKAHNQTRRVLDSYANRIGDNTWQTVITQDGLNAVKKLLRKTATKNTAVSCHWLRSRSRSEFCWVVGNRNKFNEQGMVPVNSTQKNIINKKWENTWHYFPLIKVLTALAGLFHDWGKASNCFQAKLNSTKIQGDPLRHEWVSCLLLKAMLTGAEDDAAWLEKLAKGEFNENILKEILSENKEKTPLAKLPPMASMVAWLILSHHRLPLPKSNEKQFNGYPLEHYDNLFDAINKSFGYENLDTDIDLEQCLEFQHGLPSHSVLWVKQIKKWASKALVQQTLMTQVMKSGTWRLVLHHARLTLMLGDHYYSSQPADIKWQSPLRLYANTDRASKKLKQKLDEHLVGVANNALRAIHLLPAFENEPPRVERVKSLMKKSPKTFSWQDIAVRKIKIWRDSNPKQSHSSQFGFFTVNMASTGCGKTFANAKIMQALSEDGDSLRYILALGLRTLTLQTGDEYRNRIGLDNSELAVLIGSKAVADLHDVNKLKYDENANIENNGSESLESLLDENIDYGCDIPEEGLATVLTRNKDRQFLYSPVLVCTIDHIMSATETRRGGRYILPCLRLMSSDLVIDEIDDFDGDDLVAIGRLIHLAGMLGRKVMMSSATIPPDLATGYFNAYQQGWQLFANTRGLGKEIGCAWVDEFNTQVHTLTASAKQTDEKSFHSQHESFINSRVKNLQQQAARRKANIVDIVTSGSDLSSTDTLQNNYFYSVLQEVISKHKQHYQTEHVNQKKVSFGVVRVANIKPCVTLFEYLINTKWPDNFSVKVMAYHSQQVLLMRSEQEKHLDEVLKRNQKHAAHEHPYIKKQIGETSTENVIYILIATPVEEIGRDHDFDWAIVEPSSYRSIIQLAGRVLRHRNTEPEQPNIGLMQFNLKGYQQAYSNTNRTPVFSWPGYESKQLLLDTHDLHQLIDEQAIATSINAIPRIHRNKLLNPKKSLVDLEHQVMADMLINYQQKGPESLEGWLSQCWWLTAIPQTLRPFRKGMKNQNLYLVPENSEDETVNFVFMEKDDQGRASKAEDTQGISHKRFKGDATKLWLERDYQKLLVAAAEKFNISVRHAALMYGEISVLRYQNITSRFNYSPQSGLVKE